MRIRNYDPSAFSVRFYDDVGQASDRVPLGNYGKIGGAPDGCVVILNGRAFNVHIEDLGDVDAMTSRRDPPAEVRLPNDLGGTGSRYCDGRCQPNSAGCGHLDCSAFPNAPELG